MADSESLPKAEKKSVNTAVRNADEFSERRFSETAKNKLRSFVKWLEATIDAASKPEFLGDRPTDKFDAAREKLRKINDELEVFLSALEPQQRRKVIYVLLDGMAITAEIVSLADRLRAPIWTQDIKLAEMREKKGDPAREKMERLKQALNNIKDEKQMRLSDSEKCASICKAELRRFLEASDMVNGWPGLSTIRKAIRGLGPSLKTAGAKKISQLSKSLSEKFVNLGKAF